MRPFIGCIDYDREIVKYLLGGWIGSPMFPYIFWRKYMFSCSNFMHNGLVIISYVSIPYKGIHG